jgi:NADH:ubiquinone oxidoreductase subunit 6 (subunit J)
MELFVFVCATAMIIVGALGVVLRKHPVHAALSLVLTLFGIAVLSRGEGIASNVAGDNPDANIQQLATSIFSDYVVAFEVTSILLVVAVVGTVLLSRRRTAGKP